MGKTINFTKMHGCGNDYIYIDGSSEVVPQADKPRIVRFLSDRHFGIGGDGVIFINPAKEADFEMEMYNADGSRSEMCGNGIRCVGAFVHDRGLTDKRDLHIVSAGALKRLSLSLGDGGVTKEVTVDMGAPILEPELIPVRALWNKGSSPLPTATLNIAGKSWRTSFVSMGNPHAVVLLDEKESLQDFPIDEIGPLFENNEIFPNRTNTEFVHIDSRSEVHMRVWERGTGETLACGTGCCAICVSLSLQALTDDDITVHVLGGDIRCRFDRDRGTVFMTGPAVKVFEGRITLP